MATRSYNYNGSYRPMPRPVSLDIPEPRYNYSDTRRREVKPFPRFDNDGYMPRERNRNPGYGERSFDDGYRAYEPETRRRPIQAQRPQLPRVDMQRRRRPNPNLRNKPPARRRPPPKRKEPIVRPGLLALAGLNFNFKIPPIYKHIAVVIIGLATIIAVGAILIAQSFADNALAVFVDGEHIGYIEITPGWSSEAFHDDAIMDLQIRRGVGVNVDQTVTLEPTRAAASDIVTRGAMLSQISHHHFTYTFSAVAVYVTDRLSNRERRELLMRSMADVEAARYLLTTRFQTPHTVHYGFYPDWRLVPVEIHDDNVRFHTPQEAQLILDRRIRQYEQYVVQSGDNLHLIARAHNMDLQELVRINNLTATHTIHPGQRLTVVAQAPLLRVVTIDEITRVETLDREIETIPVTTLLPGQNRVRQEGSDGEHTVITRITRWGADIVDEEIIPGEIITPAVPRIYEVGQNR